MTLWIQCEIRHRTVKNGVTDTRERVALVWLNNQDLNTTRRKSGFAVIPTNNLRFQDTRPQCG